MCSTSATNAAAAARSSAAEERNATRKTRMVRRRSSFAAAASERASASACPYSTIVAIPRTRSRKRACSRASARNWLRDGRGSADAGKRHRHRHHKSAQHQHKRGNRTGQQRSQRHKRRAEDGKFGRRQPPGIQAFDRLDPLHDRRCELARMLRSKRCRAGMQQPGKSIGPKPPPRRRAKFEGCPIVDRHDSGASQRQCNEPSQQRKFAAGPIGQRTCKQACRAPRLGHGHGNAKQAKRHHRPSRTVAGALLATQPGA